MIKDNIIRICKTHNVKISELAKLSNVPKTTIYSIVSGKSQNPGIKTIWKICSALGISLVEFFNEEEINED